jgi:dTDP-4-amino-4,6-dideoxygalactose transaminase
MEKIPLVDLRREYEEIRDEILPAMTKVIEASSFIKGGELATFEGSFARFSGSKYCVGLKSGTAALYIAQKALKVSGEVITVPNTFIATTEAITQSGNTIHFVDIDEKTMLMDLEKLKEAITPKTKAVIPVHLYGQMLDMKAVREIVGSRDIMIIEDACQAHGALFGGKPPGEFSDCACYSFYPGKNLGAYGDGGAITSNSKDLAELVSKLRDHGRGPKDKYEHSMEGYNERLDTLQAAVLNVKLKHLDVWIERRRAAAKKYDQFLGASKGVRIPHVQGGAKHAYHLYVISSEKRGGLLEHLRSRGISAGVHYPLPLHLQPAYSHMGLLRGSFPVSEKSSSEILSLPISHTISERELEYVARAVNEYC